MSNFFSSIKNIFNGNALSTMPEMATRSGIAPIHEESKGTILKRLKEMAMPEDARQLYVAAFSAVADRNYEALEIQEILDRAISGYNDDAKADMRIDATEVLTIPYPQVPASPVATENPIIDDRRVGP
jgi:hypothetical protein